MGLSDDDGDNVLMMMGAAEVAWATGGARAQYVIPSGHLGDFFIFDLCFQGNHLFVFVPTRIMVNGGAGKFQDQEGGFYASCVRRRRSILEDNEIRRRGWNMVGRVLRR